MFIQIVTERNRDLKQIENIWKEKEVEHHMSNFEHFLTENEQS
jgi:hypothetical protein